jgi:hypothetical protein
LRRFLKASANSKARRVDSRGDLLGCRRFRRGDPAAAHESVAEDRDQLTPQGAVQLQAERIVASRRPPSAKRSDGELGWCWGQNGSGEVGDGTAFRTSPVLVLPEVTPG